MHHPPVEKLVTERFRSLNASDCPPEIYSWLVEPSSMTARLSAHCQKLEVAVLREGFITYQDFTPDERHAWGEGDNQRRFWLREVQLVAEGEPWLVGRTVIPETTLQGPEAALMALGNRPLGHHLFQSTSLSRDYLTAGTVCGLWARRSMLRLSQKPLLLTEIFLPASPLYSLSAKGPSLCNP